MTTNKRLKARPAVRVVRTPPQGKRVQAPHTLISTELELEWMRHFSDGYGGSTAGIELGMIAMLYLTGSERVSASRLVELLCRTYPDMRQTIEANCQALTDAFRSQGE